jgi:O-antigen/teichoic acid export membrane protein
MKYGQYLRSTLKHGSVYGIGVILSRLIGFLMLPIYTRLLAPADYGVLEILSMTIDLLAFLTAMGLTAAVTRYFYFYEGSEDRKAVVSSAMVVLIGVFFFVTAVILPFAPNLANLLLGDRTHTNLVRLALVVFFLGSLIEIPFVYLRAKQASSQVVGYSLLRLVLTLTLNIVFVVVMRWGIRGVLLSSIISSAIIGVILFTITVRETGLVVRWPIVARMARYGAPLIVLNLGSFALHNADRYYLRAYASLTEVGIYALAYKLAMLISVLVSGPFNQIWVPKALEIERAEGSGAVPVLKEILSYYNLALVAAAFGVAVFGEVVVRVVAGVEFAAAARPIPVLCVAMVLFSSRLMSQTGAMIRERSDLIAWSTGVATAAVIVLNFLLIPRFGVMGAAWATVAAFAIEYALMSALSARVYTPLVTLPGLIRPWIAACAAFGLVRLVVPGGSPVALVAASGVLGTAVFALLLVWTGAVSPEQRALIVRGLRDPAGGLRALRGS